MQRAHALGGHLGLSEFGIYVCHPMIAGTCVIWLRPSSPNETLGFELKPVSRRCPGGVQGCPYPALSIEVPPGNWVLSQTVSRFGSEGLFETHCNCGTVTSLPRHHRSSQDKDHAREILDFILRFAVRESTIRRLLTDVPPVTIQGECGCSAFVQANLCGRAAFVANAWAEAVAAGMREKHSCVVRIFRDQLLKLFMQLHCRSCVRWIDALVDSLVVDVHDMIQPWGGLESMPATGMCQVGPQGKRRRVEDFMKDALLSRALQEQKNQTTARTLACSGVPISTSCGRKWELQKLACLKAARFLNYAEQDIFAVTVDCARVGRPGKSVVAGLCWNYATRRGSTLTPQVFVCGWQKT